MAVPPGVVLLYCPIRAAVRTSIVFRKWLEGKIFNVSVPDSGQIPGKKRNRCVTVQACLNCYMDGGVSGT